jgi:hypothetical protein
MFLGTDLFVKLYYITDRLAQKYENILQFDFKMRH